MVEVTIANFDEVLARIPDRQRTTEVIGRIVDRTRLLVERNAKMEAPVQTGTLRRSISSEMTGATSARDGVSARYGAFVELGTRPHVITPRLRKVLKFADPSFAITDQQAVEIGVGTRGSVRRTGKTAAGHGSLDTFRYGVQHPGTAPVPYLEHGLQMSVDGIVSYLERAAGEMFDPNGAGAE